LTAPADPPAESRPRGVGTLLGTLIWTTFLVSGASTSIAPFLRDMAQDLGAGLAAVGNLVGLLSAAWGVMSAMAGSASDRFGRRPILVSGVLALAVARGGLALAESYGTAAAWQFAAGLGGGTFMGTVFAAVSDRVPAAARGRALGWVLTGQSLSLVLGTPLYTFLGALAGWRGSIGIQAAATLLTAVAVWVVVPPGASRHLSGSRPRVCVARLLTPRLVALLAASAMERACFSGMAVYLATYLLTVYEISLPALAVALALVALGNLAGNLLGGQVADHFPARPLSYAASAVLTALLGLPLMLWRPGLGVSVALGFAYSLANAVGRPSLMAALSEVSSEARGAILGLNITTGSVGWLGATALGGWLITRFGFGSLGVFSSLAALAGAALAAGTLAAPRDLAAR
jgi:predicted MFS family arabinose efflux permease